MCGKNELCFLRVWYSWWYPITRTDQGEWCCYIGVFLHCFI